MHSVSCSAPGDDGTGPRILDRVVARATLALAAIAVATKLLGFVEKQVLARYFGADESADAFIVAQDLVLVVFLFVRELVEPAFLPLFVEKLADGDKGRAWRLFAVSATGIVTLTAAFCALAWICAEPLVAMLAPGLSLESKATAARLLKIMAPAAVILGLSTLTYVTLNGYRRFALPAMGDLVQKAAPVVIGVALVPRFGIAALAAGVLVGAVGRLLVHAIGLVPLTRSMPRSCPEASADVKRLLFLAAPLLIGVAVAQVSALADNYFASQAGAGGVAARSYARKIVDLPILLVAYPLSVVLFPYLSAAAARGDRRELVSTIGRTTHGLALSFAPIAVCTILLAEPIVSLLFERGSFDAGARRLTSFPLAIYGFGVVPFAIEAILVPFYYSLQDTRTPVVAGIVGVAANVTLCAILFGPLGVGGIALALVISKTMKVVWLASLLSRRGVPVAWRSVAGSAARIGLGAGAAGGLLFALLRIVPAPGPEVGWMEQASFLGMVSLLGAVTFFGVTALMGSAERRMILGVVHWISRRFRWKS
jgi:murein biosynthesis integral membrane protein MurJ